MSALAAELTVELADYADPRDAADLLAALDAYARDPMGGGKPLPEEVRGRIVPGLAATPGAFSLVARQDGTVAATEAPLGAGCVRDARVGVPARGDATLRPAFVAVVRALTSPCRTTDLGPADPAILRPGVGRVAAGSGGRPALRITARHAFR